MNTDKLNGYGMVFQASEPTEKENGIKLEESVDTVFDKISEIQKRITAKKKLRIWKMHLKNSKPNLRK